MRGKPQLGCQGGGWRRGWATSVCLWGAPQVAQRDLIKGPKRSWVWVEEKVLPTCLSVRVLISACPGLGNHSHPRPHPLATTFPGAKLLSWGAGVGAGGWQVWQAPGERPLSFSPCTTPGHWGAAPEGEVPPTNRHGPRPRERQGNKGKAARGRGLRREVNEGSRGYFTNEETEARDREVWKTAGCGGYLWVAFPSLSLMLIFLVYHTFMSVLHWREVATRAAFLYWTPA